MMHQRRIAALALAVTLGMGVAACGKQPVPDGGTAPSVATTNAPSSTGSSAARPDNVLRKTLGNGLQVVIVRDTLAPVVTTQITYRAGSYETTRDFPGTAHALEHMMFRDAAGMTGAQLHQITGKLGAGMNAFTADDATQYYFVAPSQFVNTLLKIESIRMRGAQLGTADWNLEKGAIEQEVSRDISNPAFLAFNKARKLMFAGSGYAVGGLGTRASFDKTTGAVLQQFYDRWYQPNNALLVIAGDVDLKSTMAEVERLFGAIPKGNVPERSPLNLQPFPSQTITQDTPAATGKVEYLYRMPGERSADHAALEVLMGVLNNDRSRLSDLVSGGTLLSAGAGLRSFSYGSMGVITAGFPKGSDGKHAAAALDAAIQRVLNDGVPPDLVDAVKRQTRASFEFARTSASKLASQWSHALAWQGLDSPQQALDQVLAVTPQDVDRVARKYLSTDQKITLVLTPSQNGKRPPDDKGFGGTESFASNDKLDGPLPGWADKQLADLQLPHWTLNPVQMTLDNGIKLIVQPESISKVVVVAGIIDTNESLQAPAGKAGVADVLTRLFDYGTHDLDRKAFHKALDEIAASEGAGTGFRLYVPSEHFDRGMQLLAENELHPALPQAAFETQRRKLADKLKGTLQSPSYKMRRALWEHLLPAGDPSLRWATPETVNALTLDDVKAYYTSAYRPDMTTIVVAGDITPEQAKATVVKYFGTWKASGPKPQVVSRDVPLNAAAQIMVPNSYASQDMVVAVQVLDVNLNDPDRYALELGNAVLGGNSFASRLMNDVRVKHGYAYGAGSKMAFQRSRSTFVTSYGSDPDKVRLVNGLIDKNIRAMRDEPVSTVELANAREALVRSIPRQVSSLSDIAYALMRWGYKGQPLDEPMVAARHYLDTDAQAVQAAFKQHVHPDHMVQVVVGPAPGGH